MLKQLLKNRVFIVGFIVFVCFVGGCLLYLWQLAREDAEYEAETEAIARRFNEKQNPPASPDVPVDEELPHDHDHDTAPQVPPAPPREPAPGVEVTPARVQIPEGLTDPDEIAAWEQLDYISKNIYAWGGQPSPRAAELISQLMPPRRFVGPTAHGDAEETGDMLGYLKQYRDPRAAETFAVYMCEAYVGGTMIKDALVEIGPPAVPYLIPYLELRDGVRPGRAADVLGRIGEQYRSELGGVVAHIIVPKIEQFLADVAALDDEGQGRYYTNKAWAEAALTRLQ